MKPPPLPPPGPSPAQLAAAAATTALTASASGGTTGAAVTEPPGTEAQEVVEGGEVDQEVLMPSILRPPQPLTTQGMPAITMPPITWLPGDPHGLHGGMQGGMQGGPALQWPGGLTQGRGWHGGRHGGMGSPPPHAAHAGNLMGAQGWGGPGGGRPLAINTGRGGSLEPPFPSPTALGGAGVVVGGARSNKWVRQAPGEAAAGEQAPQVGVFLLL